VTRVLIAGVSTRGLAESAARAGYDVLAVDGFGDLDLRARARSVRVARHGGRFSIRAAVAAARTLRAEVVCYVGSFENHPHGVAALAAGRLLWGNRPAVLAAVRDPVRLARALRARGFPTPAVRITAPRAGRWLVKPRASGGGGGVAPWRGGPLPRGSYLQQRVAGTAGSIVFAADGQRALAIGVSRALAGDPAFGARGFRYCGSMLVAPEEPLFGHACRLAAAVTEAFGLVGVNGIDFIARRGVPYAVEVNPRYCASMELVERACGISIFQLHARACGGDLPDMVLTGPGAALPGKAILYARSDVVPEDTAPWLEDDDVRDVPPPGERIGRGHPICTVFARGGTIAQCHAALAARARALYRSLETRSERMA
jgi:predicted ATP-grasp superfamily ATP-dependent carboligase